MGDRPSAETAAERREEPVAKQAKGPQEDPSLFCPTCSERLEELKCKLFCRRCGYYMSCADYY